MLFTNLQLMTMMLVNLFCLPLLLILPILFFLLSLLSNDVVQDNVVVDNIFHYADDVVVIVMLVLLMSMIIVCILCFLFICSKKTNMSLLVHIVTRTERFNKKILEILIDYAQVSLHY